MRRSAFLTAVSALLACIILTGVLSFTARAEEAIPLPNALLGDAYACSTLTVSGAEYSLSAGELPKGISLGKNGLLTGTPEVSGAYRFTVTAKAGEFAKSQSYTLTVQPFVVRTKALPDVIPDTPYSAQLAVTGGAPATFALVSGTLPEGLTLQADGLLSGTSEGITEPITLVISATAAGNTVQQTLVLHPASAAITVTPDTPPSDIYMLGEKYTFTLLISGGSGLYNTSISGKGIENVQILPNGNQIDVTISGKKAGDVGTLIAVFDAANTSVNVTYTVKTKVIAPLAYHPLSEKPLEPEDIPFTMQLTAEGGSGSYKFTPSDTLPEGFALSPEGLLSGIGKAGSYSIAVQLTDTVYPSLTAFGNVAFDIYGKPVVHAEPWLRGHLETTLTVEGGVPPYSVTVLASSTDEALQAAVIQPGGTDQTFTISLPEGLQGSLTLSCVDSKLQETSCAYTVDTRKELIFTCSDIPDGIAGAAYDVQLTFTHDITDPVSFIIEGLPEGLTADEAGHITGTPKVSGSYPLVITGICEALDTTSAVDTVLTIKSSSKITVTAVSGLESADVDSGNPTRYRMIPKAGATEAKFTVTASDNSAVLSWNGSAITSGDTITQTVADNTAFDGTLTMVVDDVTTTWTMLFAVPGESVKITGLPDVLYENVAFPLTVAVSPAHAYITPVEWQYDTTNITHTAGNPAEFTVKTSGTYTIKVTTTDAYGKEMTANIQFRANVEIVEVTPIPATKRPSVNPTVKPTKKPTPAPTAVPTPTPKPNVTLTPRDTMPPSEEATDPDLDWNTPTPKPAEMLDNTPEVSPDVSPDISPNPDQQEKKGAPLWLWPLLVALVILIPSLVFLIIRSIRLRNQPIVEAQDELKVVDKFELPPELPKEVTVDNKDNTP